MGNTALQTFHPSQIESSQNILLIVISHIILFEQKWLKHWARILIPEGITYTQLLLIPSYHIHFFLVCLTIDHYRTIK